MGNTASVIVAQAQFPHSITAEESPQGELSFKILPDKSVEVEITGNLRGAFTDDEPPPMQSMSFDLTLSPSATDLTRVEGSSVIKFTPTYSEQLSGLDLALDIHSVNNADEMTIQFQLPDYLGIEGTIDRSTDEATSETTITFELSATIWYTTAAKEAIQEVTKNFPLYKQQLEIQVNQLTEGNLSIEELNLLGSSFGPTSATLTLSGAITGNLYQGFATLMTQTIQQEIRPPTQTINSAKLKSGDLHLKFDKTELALKIEFDWVVEGDINKQANDIKDLLSEEYLQSPNITPETAVIINDLLIPTKLNVENLNTHYEIAFDGQYMASKFQVSRLRFTPPTQEEFLSNLDQALVKYPMPGYNIVFEGGSDDTGYLEILVPKANPAPGEDDHRTAVFSSSNLANLDQISFEARKWPTSTLRLNQTILAQGEAVTVEGTLTQEGVPVMGKIVTIRANNKIIGTATTEDDGGFSHAYRFEDAGTYEVKSSLSFYEKNVESQPVIVTVSSPTVALTNLLPQIAGGAIILAIAVGVVIFKKKARVTAQ